MTLTWKQISEETVPELSHARSAKQQKSIFLCQIVKNAEIKSQTQQRPTMRTLSPWNEKQVCTKVKESVSTLSPEPLCIHCPSPLSLPHFGTERIHFKFMFLSQINQQSFPAWLSIKSCRLTSSAGNLYEPRCCKDKLLHRVCLIEAFSPVCDICFGVCESQ